MCRYVGLLLVTKLLPAGDERTLTAVHDAVGAAFLQRLLLPLSSAAVRGAVLIRYSAFILLPIHVCRLSAEAAWLSHTATTSLRETWCRFTPLNTLCFYHRILGTFRL